jgi:hypothetical protein
MERFFSLVSYLRVKEGAGFKFPRTNTLAYFILTIKTFYNNLLSPSSQEEERNALQIQKFSKRS